MMIGKIVQKELLENINSLRFVLALLLIVSLFIVSGIVFINRYTQEVEDYHRETNKNISALNEQAKNLSSIAFYQQVIYRKPTVLQLCVEGFEKSLPNTFTTDVFSVQYPEIKSRGNFLLPRFSDIDWAFIISYILSFVALLLTFDSISGEKEGGTLPLMLANPVPRDTVLLAKYCGAMLTLGIPLFLGIMINLLIVNSSSMISISREEWLKILVVILVSLVYLSIFILLGVIVSNRTARSSTSIVILLFLWAALVIIIPSCGRLVAEKFHPIPGRTEIERRIADIQQQIWNEGTRPPSKAGTWAGNPFAEYVPARAKLFNKMIDVRNRISDTYINQMLAQIHTSRNVIRISPTTLYQYASEAIIGTGISRFEAFYNQIKRYKEHLKAYVLDKDKEDPDSVHLLFDNRSSAICISQKPVDFNTIPQFEEMSPLLVESLKSVVWDVAALVTLNILLFLGGYILFLNYEVV